MNNATKSLILRIITVSVSVNNCQLLTYHFSIFSIKSDIYWRVNMQADKQRQRGGIMSKLLVLLVLLFGAAIVLHIPLNTYGKQIEQFVSSLSSQFDTTTLNEIASNTHLLPTPTVVYQAPNTQIAQLADEASMTEKAKQIFYSTHPVVVTDRATFERDCQAPVTSDSIELGCFTPDNRIYILGISNPQLQGQMVVTAAHEMLHAAYAQLSTTQRNTVDSELEQELPYLQNKQLSRELRSYKQTEPGERDNELHSIIGTEYPQLSSSLEAYYGQYFINRSQVVSYAQQFNQVFSNLESDLTALNTEIRQTRKEMHTDLNSQDIEGYNALVPQINGYINQYNQDVAEYNELSRSLMGNESPVQQQ